MSVSKSYVLLSPEYEEIYEYRYGKQPKYIPVNFIPNFGLPSIINNTQDYSRTWVTNPNAKKN